MKPVYDACLNRSQCCVFFLDFGVKGNGEQDRRKSK